MTDIPAQPAQTSGLTGALVTQGRIINALLFRELQSRFGRLQFGALWLLIEPLAYAAILTFVKSFIGRNSPIGTSLEIFFFTGLVPYMMFRNLSSRLLGAIDNNRALLYLPIITNIDVILARAFLEISILGVAFIIWMSALWGLNLQYIPDDPLKFLSALGAAMLLGMGLGTLNAVIAGVMPTWGKIVPWIMRAMFITSGVLWSNARFPHELMQYLSWNPLLHVVEWSRSGFYAEYESTILDRSYVLFVGAALWACGLVLERLLQRQLSIR